MNFFPVKKSYQLEALARNCMSMWFDFDDHSALEDIKALRPLRFHLNRSCDGLLKHSFSVEFVISSIQYKSKTNDNLVSLQQLSDYVPDTR